MTSPRTEREMTAGAANSARFAAMPVRRSKPEAWVGSMEPVYRPPEGVGSQERMKVFPGMPGAIGHAKNLFRLGR
jgi:hypothetical protein